MKKYPAYKDSGIEWIGEIPEHWEVKKLKNFSKIVNGSTPKSGKGEYWGNEIVWVTPNDLGKLNGNRITDSLKKITQRGLNSCGTTLTPKNSIILSTRAPIGHIGITDILTCTNQGCKTIVSDSSKCENKFLFYYLFSSKNTLLSLGQGSTFIELSSQNLKDFQNPVPPFHEQQTIANYLDRKTRQIDTLIENKKKLIDLLKEQRAAIINKAVTKGLNPNVKLKDSGIEWLGEIPEHWGIARLKFISNIKYGLGQPPRALEEGLPIIRATNIKEGKISPDDLLYVDPKDVPYDRDPILKENDIIVVRSGAYTGDSAIIPREYEGAVAGYDMVACVHKANPEYIAYSLLSHSILHNQIDLCRLRAAQPHLNAEELGDTLVFLPPNDEQKMIVEFIKHESEMIVSINQNLEELIKCLKEYRTALISEVVTGKIDVRDSGIQEVIHS